MEFVKSAKFFVRYGNFINGCSHIDKSFYTGVIQSVKSINKECYAGYYHDPITQLFSTLLSVAGIVVIAMISSFTCLQL